jgi:hypothetical protein
MGSTEKDERGATLQTATERDTSDAEKRRGNGKAREAGRRRGDLKSTQTQGIQHEPPSPPRGSVCPRPSSVPRAWCPCQVAFGWLLLSSSSRSVHCFCRRQPTHRTEAAKRRGGQSRGEKQEAMTRAAVTPALFCPLPLSVGQQQTKRRAKGPGSQRRCFSETAGQAGDATRHRITQCVPHTNQKRDERETRKAHTTKHCLLSAPIYLRVSIMHGKI